MKNKISLYIVLISLLLLSCSQHDPSEKEEVVFYSETVLVENDYPEIKDQNVINALENLKICSNVDTNTLLPICQANNFRFFPLGQEISTKKGFILEVNSDVFDAPFKQVMVIVRSFNKFKIVNRYLGFLIEYRTSRSGYYDLLMGYKDPEMGLIALRHEWKEDNYMPEDVEEINGYFIKEIYKDSINNLFINNFNAGY